MQSSERYIRQIILPGFGLPAQEKLGSARVLLVGMGGLGCPALQYLVGAGIGKLGIVDPDSVSMSNLHRQLLFDETDIGKKKVEVAAAKMKKLNSECHIDIYPVALNNQNGLDLVADYDLVIDATDNFPAKYLINDACLILNKPFIYGAVNRYEGQLSVFNLISKEKDPINYRDLFPVPPHAGEIRNCEETGVLGVLPGIIGSMQAAEAVKLVTGLGNPIYGRLFNYDLLKGSSYEILLTRKAERFIIDKETFRQMDYGLTCNEHEEDTTEISVKEFDRLISQPDSFVLDVREWHEYPKISFSNAQIPMSELIAGIGSLPDNKKICVVCHLGIRSIYAAQLIKSKRNLDVYSLKGGLTAYFA